MTRDVNEPQSDYYYQEKSRAEPVPRYYTKRNPTLRPYDGRNHLSLGPFRFGIGGGNRVCRSSRTA